MLRSDRDLRHVLGWFFVGKEKHQLCIYLLGCLFSPKIVPRCNPEMRTVPVPIPSMYFFPGGFGKIECPSFAGNKS